jgi:hypothetical protein
MTFRQQAEAAERMWPAMRAGILKAARETYPNATITEMGDEIIITLPGVVKTVECTVHYTEDPMADGLKPSPMIAPAVYCPECLDLLDDRHTCPGCGWA